MEREPGEVVAVSPDAACRAVALAPPSKTDNHTATPAGSHCRALRSRRMDQGMDEGSAGAKAICARTCTGVITVGTATSTATWPMIRHVALSAVDSDSSTEEEEEEGEGAPQDRDQLPNLKAASKAGETPTFASPESSTYT